MLASLEWLRSLCPVEKDVRTIADALTSRGLTVDAVEPAGDDHALDIDIPANRPDCLGHLGLARELSAAFGVALREPEGPATPGPGEAAGLLRVEIEAPELCGRYAASIVREVRIGPSPGWAVRRLETCGLRPINNVVDASNLVMLELGSPIHFFDLARVREATIRVRRARKGERLTTLDGEARTLDQEMLVIADDTTASALAGVMGGADSEIGDATTDVLIEAAWFLPASIRRTSRRLNLQTDASHRFSRGVDPERVLHAQALAIRLLTELAGGSPVPGIVDAYPAPPPERSLELRPGQVGRLLGFQPAGEEITGALEALRLSPRSGTDGRIRVHVPSWRVDLEREADLVEEVARHVGYDRVPAESTGMPATSAPAVPPGSEERARDLLAHEGFHEALGYSMVGRDEDAPFTGPDTRAGLPLTNPIAESLALLRRSILPGLVRSADLNHRRGIRDVRLFEVGRVFLATGPGSFPDEPTRVGIAWSGAGQPPHWGLPDREVDLYDLIGLVEKLQGRLAQDEGLSREPGDLPGFHPGKSVTWKRGDGTVVARCGALHPVAQATLLHPLFLAEVDLGAGPEPAVRIPQYRALPRLTAVARDLSVIVTEDVSFSRIREVMRSVPAPAPVHFRVADRYLGAPLPEGQASLTVRLVLQPDEKALTDGEIDGYRLALVAALKDQLNLEIRG